MNDELDQLLINLRLKGIHKIAPDELKKAAKNQPTYAEFLTNLMRAQWIHAQQSAMDYRFKQARLPEQWTLETFPFKLQPGVSERQFKVFAGLDFIARAENIVLIGPTGVGKTGLATALLIKALQNGHRGLFIRAQDLFDEMYASMADRSSRALINRLANVQVLVVDEMGYLNVKPEQANIFFRLMEERHRKVPTIITTNLAYDQWETFLANKHLTGALLSRLRQQCHTVIIDGPSLRDPQISA